MRSVGNGDIARLLWTGAIVFFGIGDVVTTGIGLSHGAVELHPIVGPWVEQYRVLAMVPLKLLVFACSYWLWQRVPAPERIGIPIGLAGIGLLVTVWNVYVLANVL